MKITTIPALTSTPTLVTETIASNDSNLSNYLCSTFDMSINYSGTGNTGNICLDDILITDDGIQTYFDPSVTFTINSSSGTSGPLTIGPLTIGTSNNGNIAWYAPVSSAQGGSITFTNGSPTVTISSGSFGTYPYGVNAGNWIRSANDDPSSWYEVKTVNNSTSITLYSNYAGTTNTSSFYVQDGYYYACKANVTQYVQAFSDNALPTSSGNGNGTYTVSNLYSGTHSQENDAPTSTNPEGMLGDSAYAGWSLVIVYSDSSTLGHQLYLYDEFQSVPNHGSGGGPEVINEKLSGFVVPGQVAGDSSSSDVAKLTCFVGEGDADSGHSGDYVAYDNTTVTPNVLTELWDGITCYDNTGSGYDTPTGNSDGGSAPYNVWNSSWIDQATMKPANVPGVDIDTFHIEWGERLIATNQTSATIQLSTNGDGYVLVYMIAAFRSSVTSGGAISYLITREPN
jgi:hypothetical protein